MLKLSFQFNGATITVRRADVRARLLKSRVYRNFDISAGMPTDDFLAIDLFVQFLTQTTVEGNLGFPIPAATASRAEILAAFDAFMSLPETFYDLYAPLKHQVDGLIGDPELATIDDDEKKTAS